MQGSRSNVGTPLEQQNCSNTTFRSCLTVLTPDPRAVRLASNTHTQHCWNASMGGYISPKIDGIFFIPVIVFTGLLVNHW